MSLPQVVPRLTEAGPQVDLCSWYPWLHDEDQGQGFYLGMDSCAMFHIGGDVVCDMDWDVNKIGDLLLDAARAPGDRPRSRQGQRSLHTYSGKNFPGQLWDRYKNRRNEDRSSMSLEAKLQGLLQPSTTPERLNEMLVMLQQKREQFKSERKDRIARGGNPDEEEQDYLPSSAYLKLKQKKHRPTRVAAGPQHRRSA